MCSHKKCPPPTGGNCGEPELVAGVERGRAAGGVVRQRHSAGAQLLANVAAHVHQLQVHGREGPPQVSGQTRE